MKQILFIVSLGLLLSSCDNSLDVNAPYKDVPIVYGIINASDTAQYIKLERVFQSNDQSAFEVAKIIDSLYYPNATVSLTNERTGIKTELSRVDGALEGYPRESGVFATNPNYLYKAKSSELDIKGEDRFTLEIRRNENSDLVTSSINIVEQPDILSPQPSSVGPNLYFSSKFKTRIRRGKSTYGKAMDVSYFINIFEVNHANNTTETKTLEWNIVKGYEGLKYEFDGAKFYTFLATNLEVNSNITRTIQSISIKFVLGGEDIVDFIKLGQSNSFSITSSEAIPNFTNLSEGLGLFSSYSEILMEGYGISPTTIDTLIYSEITKDYNFTE